MKLYLNDTSPFSRVVLATALLCDCRQLTLEWVDPWQSSETLRRVNPFCMIPTLELEEGTALTESLSICQYLIQTSHTKRLRDVDHQHPGEMMNMGMAKTMMESAFRSVALGRFVDAENELSQRSKIGLQHALIKLENELATPRHSLYLLPNLATLLAQINVDALSSKPNFTELFA
ncbi:glutathione S-transferase N-terminal domain-containing protein [Vibrio cholerae]|nr:glutathione S-transferase [Vibrio cholerae]GIC18498.1 glutathione S-transferase [Vibrio cholerae]